jgi:hypothetical protein
VLVAISFVPMWATYRVPGLGLFAPDTRRVDALDAYGLGMELALLLSTGVVALAVGGGAGRSRGTRYAPALFVLAGAATLALLWEAVAGPQGSSEPNGYGISRGVLLFVGTGLACGMTYGGYLALRGSKPDRRIEEADRGE